MTAVLALAALVVGYVLWAVFLRLSKPTGVPRHAKGARR